MHRGKLAVGVCGSDKIPKAKEKEERKAAARQAEEAEPGVV